MKLFSPAKLNSQSALTTPEEPQVRIAQDHPQRRQLVRESRVMAASLQPEHRQQRERRPAEHHGSDEERQRLPQSEQEAADEQRQP
jgi:hypothetical protein